MVVVVVVVVSVNLPNRPVQMSKYYTSMCKAATATAAAAAINIFTHVTENNRIPSFLVQ